MKRGAKVSLVTMAEVYHPFPSRTRKLSPPAPMVLFNRESRSLPGFFIFSPFLKKIKKFFSKLKQN